jgi:NhaP-type Na+/H+ or K+/H+ antiporter
LAGGSNEVGPFKGGVTITVTLVFMVLACFLGVLAEQVLKKIRKLGGPAIPYTAFILIIGLVTRIAGETRGTYRHFSCSFHVWETMDGHLLLYAFIPPLVFGDAMNLDFNILKNCLSQCAMLAFPGVAIGAATFAVIVKYIIPSTSAWTWDLSMAFGSVMSATDPVAVVALLKQLGAPDSLTMIIGGESLLNDGMAMILWAVFFNREMRKEFSPNISVYIVVLFFGSILIGLIFGIVWRLLLGLHSSSLDHTNGIMQTVLTIAGSYICFYVAEAIFAASGVMAVVVMGMFLCMTFWTVSAEPEIFNGTWHTLEWCFNTVLFQMSGLIIADQFIKAINMGRVKEYSCDKLFADAGIVVYDPQWGKMVGEGIALYLLALLIRSFIVALFFPILQRLGYGITWQGAIVASWGGLRGAVGLALAIVMKTELAHRAKTELAHQPELRIDMELDGMRIIIYVAITAVGTLLINATTTGPIVRALGLTSVPKVEVKAMNNVRRSLQEHSEEQFEKLQDEFEWGSYSAEDQDKWEEWVFKKLTLLSGLGRDYMREMRKNNIKKRESQAAIAGENESSTSPAAAMNDPARKRAALKKSDTASGGMMGKIVDRAGPEDNVKIGIDGTAKSAFSGKVHLKHLINKVATTVHVKHHRERITFVRSMFCRHLKLRYDNLVRTQLQGHPQLAIQLRSSVDAASDMLRQSELNTKEVHGEILTEGSPKLADLSLIMRSAAPSRLLLHLARSPNGCLSKLIGCFGSFGGRALRTKVRTDAVKALTALECYLIAHKEAQEHTKAILVAHGAEDGFLSEVNAVTAESTASMELADEYVEVLKTLSIAGESLTQLEEGLRARRTALELVSRMMKHIHHQADEGAMNSREEHKLLHELEHDAQRLRAGIAPTIDGAGGKNLVPLTKDQLKDFMLAFEEKHKDYKKKIDASNNYSDLRTPWCSWQKIHGDMEQEGKASLETKRYKKFISTRSIFMTKEQKEAAKQKEEAKKARKPQGNSADKAHLSSQSSV